MERRRASLYAAADRFIWAEAKNGFVHQHRENLRNTGWLMGDLEGNDRAQAVADERARTIRAAAHETIKAYEDLLDAARRRKLNLDAIAAPAPFPPWIKSASTQ